MNKYQWALHRLWSAINRNEYLIYDKQLMEELVEKATPKKPIKDGSGYLTCDKVQYICPSCNQIMVRVICIKSHKPNYCYKCGGALDWSDDE